MSLPTRRLHVRHTTRYSYDRPVSRSLHRLHLKPIDRLPADAGRLQADDLATPTQVIEFEDVFGNRGRPVRHDEPYTELTVTAESMVDVVDVDPFAFASSRSARRSRSSGCRPSG